MEGANFAFKRIVLFIILSCFSTSLKSQEGRYDFLPLGIYTKIYVESRYDTIDELHFSIWPQRANYIKYDRKERLDYVNDSICYYKNSSKLKRKLFCEDLLSVETDKFALTINPILNQTVGFDNFLVGEKYTFMNTRGILVEGRLGSKLTFMTSFMEQQAFFPNYQADYFRSKKSTLGWVMHRGFKDRGYDFPLSLGQVSYTPNSIFSFNFGHGNHFFGEGYRSMFLSNHTVPYGFFKIETSIGKIKYVNLYSLMNDINENYIINGKYARKYASIHFLSWNITKRLNINFYESIVIGSDPLQGINNPDWNFLNPVILFRALEANRGFETGNIMVGMGFSYKLLKGMKLYGQLALDDFKLEGLKSLSKGHRHNYHAWQLGVKMPNAFDIRNLYFLTELNQARPFMYSHRSTLTNYEHQGLPLAHPWETNFREWVLMSTYRFQRWEFLARINLGIRGLDTGGVNNGSDIRRNYADRPEEELGFFVGGPAGKQIFYFTSGISYVINPVSNLKFEIQYTYRKEQFVGNFLDINNNIFLNNANWFSVGFKTSLFWGYNDF